MKPRQTFMRLVLIWLIGLPALSACGANVPQPTPVPSAAMTLAPSATPIPSATATVTLTPTESFTPTLTFTPTDTFTPTATITLTPTATLNWAALMKTQVLVYLVNVIDADTCNYEMLPVPVPSRPKTGDMLTDIEWALKSLFLTKVNYIGYLTNPLAPSQLSFDHIDFDGSTMNVYLQGQVVQTDSICTDGQARDQVFATIRRYLEDPYLQLVVWVGPYLLDDMLWRK